MTTSIAKPTARVTTNYRHDIVSALDLTSGVLVDLQHRIVSDATVAPYATNEDVPWRDAAHDLVEELRSIVTALAITLAPSPDAPLNRLDERGSRA